MDNPENYILLWQCKEAVEIAQKLHPHLIRRKDWLEDKLVLRKAAIELGIPPYLALTPKVPMQESSGALSAIVRGHNNNCKIFTEIKHIEVLKVKICSGRQQECFSC